jgi:hypothetical protein
MESGKTFEYPIWGARDEGPFTNIISYKTSMANDYSGKKKKRLLRSFQKTTKGHGKWNR